MITSYLDPKYIQLVSGNLERFRKKSNTTYNFRCPFCGDSEKNVSKARGYLFSTPEGFAYKCHNCGVSTSLLRFLMYVNPALATSYRIEKLASANVTTSQPSIQTPPSPTKSLEEIGCEPISRLSETSVAVQYLQSRKIPRDKWNNLFYISDASKLSGLNSAYEGRLRAEGRIIIPFYDSQGNLSGVTARSLGSSKLRYLTVRITQYPMIYGMPFVEKSLPIYVCEGAFDSMFIPNSVAVGGSDLMRAIGCFPECDLIFLFDNEPRNVAIVKLMEKLIARNHKLVIWPQSWKFKDINEAMISGLDTASLMDIIYRNTHMGLSSKLAIREWKRTCL